MVGIIFKFYHMTLDKLYDLRNNSIKKKLKYCGRDVVFHGAINITKPEFVKIGNNVHIGENAFISSLGGLSIGDNTHISRNLVIYTHSHNYGGSLLPYDNSMIKKKVSIGKNVWIGMNVNIVPGVEIGDGAIIGLGTVVTNDVPPLAIVGSEKMRIIKYRDSEHYNNLEKNNRYGAKNGDEYIK